MFNTAVQGRNFCRCLLGIWTFLSVLFVSPARGQERVSERIWGETLAEAKKEGEVVIYGGSNHESYFREFQQRFPEIRVKFLLGEGFQLVPRIITEIRARKYIGDIFIGGLTPPYEHLYKNGLLARFKPALILPAGEGRGLFFCQQSQDHGCEQD